jgi:phage terminase large subunit
LNKSPKSKVPRVEKAKERLRELQSVNEGRVLEMKMSRVLAETLAHVESGKRVIVNQGGTRSSKTFSLCQLFIIRALQEKAIFSVVRASMPPLRGSAMRDFQALLEQYDLYNPELHDRTNSIYKIGRSEVEFFGVDESQKVRGRKRKYLWLNEANELAYEDFLQLALRTTGTIFLDYNPSEIDHWIYDKVLTRGDVALVKSTYLDNPFLDEITVKEIERLKDEDENLWRVYGLGERGIRRTAVYTRYAMGGEMPENCTDYIWGLDFGYNPDPTCLMRCGFRGGELFADEWIYERNLTNSMLIEKMKELGVSGQIVCDSAEPDRIMELQNAGFNVYGSKKGAGSVRQGVDACLKYHVQFTDRSFNGYRDWRGYSTKTDRNGLIIPGEYVKFNVHACDAIRYAVQFVNLPQASVWVH